MGQIDQVTRGGDHGNRVAQQSDAALCTAPPALVVLFYTLSIPLPQRTARSGTRQSSFYKSLPLLTFFNILHTSARDTRALDEAHLCFILQTLSVVCATLSIIHQAQGLERERETICIMVVCMNQFYFFLQSDNTIIRSMAQPRHSDDISNFSFVGSSTCCLIFFGAPSESHVHWMCACYW